MGGHHEAAHVEVALAQLVLHEPARPQALEHGEGAKVFALAAEAGAFADGSVPQGVGVLALALGDVEVLTVVGQPFGLAGEVAAVALLAAVLALGGGAHALGAGGEAVEQLVERGVEHASVGPVEARAFEIERFLQALPGGAGQEAAVAEEGFAGLRQLADVRGAVALLHQRGEGHRGPMHLGEAVELGGQLGVAGQLRGVGDAGVGQQLGEHARRGVAHEAAHRLSDDFGQLPGLARRHDGDQLVGQRRSEQGVGVGAVSYPLAAFREALGVQPHLVAQPQVHQRHAAQLGEDHRVRAEPFADHLEALPGDARQQVRAGPQVGAGARLGDEVLHRAEAHRQQRRIGAAVGGKRRGKGGGEVEVGPDGVVGDARIGRQLLPKGAQAIGVDLGAEAPEGEGAAARVGLAVGVALDEALEVVDGGGLDVRGVDVELAQRVFGAGERVDQDRGFGEAHLGPGGVAAVLGVARKLRPVGGAGPVVGALDVGGERAEAAGEEGLLQFAHRAAFVAGGVAQQDEGLFGGVVGPGCQLGEPDVLGVVGHGGPLRSGETGERGVVEVALDPLPGAKQVDALVG